MLWSHLTNRLVELVLNRLAMFGAALGPVKDRKWLQGISYGNQGTWFAWNVLSKCQQHFGRLGCTAGIALITQMSNPHLVDFFNAMYAFDWPPFISRLSLLTAAYNILNDFQRICRWAFRSSKGEMSKKNANSFTITHSPKPFRLGRQHNVPFVHSNDRSFFISQ